MKLWILGTLLCLAASVSRADADLTLLRDLVGFYPVYDLNSDAGISGVLEVVATPDGVGYRLTELKSDAGSNLAPQEDVTDSHVTELKPEGTLIVQEFHSDLGSLRVEFQKKGNQVSIHSVKCPKEQPCELTQVNSTPVVADSVDAKAFFSTIKGSYKIEKVGGEAPHDGNDIADVSENGSEANLTFPYCPNAGGVCDPGYLDLPYGEIKVTKKTASATHITYEIVFGTKRYTWEVVGSTVYFRNYQYQTSSGRVVALTHQMKKS